jgi:hypothetical protein
MAKFGPTSEYILFCWLQIVMTCDPYLIAAILDRSAEGKVIDKPGLYKKHDLVWPAERDCSIVLFCPQVLESLKCAIIE